MNFKIPNGHRNNSYRNEPTYLPPGHSTKPSVRRQKFHALMEEIDAKTAPTSIVAIKLVVLKGSVRFAPESVRQLLSPRVRRTIFR